MTQDKKHPFDTAPEDGPVSASESSAGHSGDIGADAPKPETTPYEVGYGKPPKHTRFKKGQSGNHKGRRKGVKNFSTQASEMLNSKVKVVKDGRSTSVTTIEAAFMRLKEKALKGDARALDRIIDMAATASELENAGAQEQRFNRLEQDILKRGAWFGQQSNDQASTSDKKDDTDVS